MFAGNIRFFSIYAASPGHIKVEVKHQTAQITLYTGIRYIISSKRLCYIWSPCRTTGHFLLLVFDDFESSLTILNLVHLVFIMGSSPLDMSLKRVLAMDYNSF